MGGFAFRLRADIGNASRHIGQAAISRSHRLQASAALSKRSEGIVWEDIGYAGVDRGRAVCKTLRVVALQMKADMAMGVRPAKWPKNVPALTNEQSRISDDWMKHWHEVLPTRYGAIEAFNHGYPLRMLPEEPQFRTLEPGAGIGAHIAREDLSRQDYHCIEFDRSYF